jgi:hypothetical protein
MVFTSLPRQLQTSAVVEDPADGFYVFTSAVANLGSGCKPCRWFLRQTTIGRVFDHCRGLQ